MKLLRKKIVAAAGLYRSKLAGKSFLYVFEDSSFELVFMVDRFLHLTGVGTSLNAKDFYKKAAGGTLTTKQFFCATEQDFNKANDKLDALLSIDRLTDSLVCILVDMRTASVTYRHGLTNLHFTLGTVEKIDRTGTVIPNFFVPRTLRIRDKAVENSADAVFCDFIFSKPVELSKYGSVMYKESGKVPPEAIRAMLSDDLIAELYHDT